MADASIPSIGGVRVDILAGTNQFNKALVQAEQRARNTGGVMVREFDRADRSAQRLDATLKRSASTLALFGGGFAGISLLKGIVESADAMNLLKGRIANVISEGESLNRVQKDLFTSAQQNRASIEGTANLYLRLRNTIKDLNHEQALALTSTFSKSLILSGASASEAASSMLQFSQAMASGRLQGDELRSLLENNSRFARALAESLGVTVGQLKALGEAGALTTDLVGKALKDQAASIDAEFQNVPTTVGQAFQQLQNGLLEYIGQTDSSFGVTERVAQGIYALTKNIEDLGNALLILGAAGGTYAALKGLQLFASRAAIYAVEIGAALESFNMKSDPRFKSGLARQINDSISEMFTAERNLKASQNRLLKLEKDFERERAQAYLVGERANTRKYLAERAAAENLVLNAQRAQKAAQANYDGIRTKFDAAGNAATKFSSKLLSAGGALVNFFGGPVGLAMLTFSAAAAVLTANAIEAARAARSMQTGLELVEGMNIGVSKAAAEALGKTEALTRATDAQAKAVAALTAKRRDDLRAQLEQAALDARNTAKAARNRIAELEGLNNAPFTAQAIKDFRKPYLDQARKELAEAEKLLPILEAGVEAVNSGMADLGKTTEDTRSEVQRAVDAFKEGVAAINASNITDTKFKSNAIKGALEKLAETDLASARAQLGSVRNLLTDQDAAAVEKNFIRMAKATLTTKASLNEFNTEAEKFRKALKDIAVADPSEGNKSRAALQAVLDYGRELKNLPEAYRSIDGIKLLTPEDAETARRELYEIADAAAAAFGTEAQQAAAAYGRALGEINDAEDALKAVSANYDPQVFEAARAILLQDKNEKTRQWPVDDFEEMSSIIRDMLTPTERLREELAEIENLRAGANPTEAQALDRKRVSLLEDEARAAGYAGEALLTLQRLRAATGMTDAEVRDMQRRILDSAEDGRSNMRWGELSTNQKTEAASKFFADTFTDALSEGIKTSNFGDALRDVIAQKAAEGLANSIADVGQQLGDMLFGKDGMVWSTVGSLFGTGLPARAEGGRVKAGQAYMTGEKGREIFIPGADGYIAPNSALKGTGASYENARGGPRLAIDLSTHIAGDVGTREMYERMQAEQRANMRALPGLIRGQFREIRRRN